MEGLEGLKGLRGLQGLSSEDLRAWEEANSEKLKGKTFSKRDRLFRNQQFIQAFGLEEFKKYDKDQRDSMYRDKIVGDIFTNKYSPIEGVGGIENFDYYNRMSTDFKLRALEEGIKTDSEIDTEYSNLNKEIKDIYKNTPDWLVSLTTAHNPAMALEMQSREYTDAYDEATTDTAKADNKAKLEDIYSEWLKTEQDRLAPVVESIYNSEISQLNDQQVDAIFSDIIEPKKDVQLGITGYAAYKDTKWMKDFSLDQKREVLAKYYAYQKVGMPAEDIAKALDNEAQDYIEGKQDTWDIIRLGAQDIAVTGVAYTGQKLAGLEASALGAYSAVTGDDAKIYVLKDGSGTIVPKKDVLEGKVSRDQVMETSINRGSLFIRGYNADGTKNDSWLNPQYLEKATMYGTLDDEEIVEADKYGRSVHKLEWGAKKETDITYDTAKMLAYTTADVLTEVLPMGIGKINKAINGVDKVAKMANKTLNILETAARYTNAGMSAIGNAFANATGDYGATLQENLYNLEKTQRRISEDVTRDWINNNSEEFNNQVQEEKRRLIEQIKATSEGRGFVNEEFVEQQAQQNIINALVQKNYNEAKSSDDYNKAVEEAYANAAGAAYNTLITNSVKGALDNIGYRRFLFMDKAKMAKQATESATENILFENGKLVLNNLTRPDKIKKFGKHLGNQMIGGFADEYGENLLMGGSREVSSDLFEQYLNSYENGEALEGVITVGSTLLAVLNGAFMRGIKKIVVSEDALYEGLIGGLGANLPIVNLHNIANYKAIREQWAKEGHNPSILEHINNFVTNGTLSEYYAELQGHRQLQQQVEAVNKFLDETNWGDIKNIAATDIMIDEATGPRDLKTAQFMKALNVVQALQASEGDATVESMLSKAEPFVEAKSLWEAATNDKLTKEQIDNLLKEYYSKNPSVVKSEENDALALEQIKDNSKRLLEASDRLDSARILMDKVEQTTGKKFDDGTRKYVTFRSIMSEEFARRAGKMEEEVSGNKSNTSEVSSLLNLASYGTDLDSTMSSLEDKQTSLIGEIGSTRDKLETLGKDTSEYKETLQELNRLEVDLENTKTVITDLIIAQQEIVGEYDSTNPDSELSPSEKVNKSITPESIFGFKVDVYNPEHIDRAEKFVRNLNSKVRARVISSIAMSRADKSAAPVFEGEIGKVLNKVYDRILTTDPEALQKIQDIPILQEQRTLVESELTEAINNPELAAQKLATQHTKELQAASTVFNHKAAEQIEGHTRVIEQVLRQSNMSEEDVQNALFHHLKQYKPSYLQSIKERDRDLARKYREVIDRAIKMQELIGDIVTYSSTTAITPEQKENFSKEVSKVLNNPNIRSKEDALKAFSDLAEDSNLEDSYREFYAKLSDALEAIQSQRNATEVVTEEVKKERAERRKKAKKDYADRLAAEREKAIKEQLEREAEEERKKEEAKSSKATEKAYEESILGTPEEEAKTDVTPEVARTETNTEDIDLESPSIDKQVVSSDKAKIVPPNAPKVDSRPREVQSSTVLIGNSMYRYDMKSLTEDGYEVPRMGTKENDSMSKFFNWMDSAGLNFQEVIDNELSDILKVNSKVQFLMVNPQKNATNDVDMQDHVLEVIEYTPEVAKIHTSIDGTLEANGKRWLVIGALGFNGREQGTEYRRVKDLQLKPNRKKYFDSNPTERFYVDPNHSTEISSVTTGYIVRKLKGDSEVQVRTISELLADKSRNPEGLSMEDLAWGLAQDSKFVVVGVNEDSVLTPNDLSGNAGNIFIMVKATDGRYIPLAIKPTMYSEINDGTLKKNIDTLLNELTSPVYAERRAAINTLVQLIHLSTDGKNILIGKEDRNTLSISENGVITHTFDLNSPDFNRQDFLDAVTKLSPRVNITVSSLSNPTELRILDEAGALTTDAAKLGVSGGSFKVYNIDTQGNPIIDEAINTSSQRESNSDYSRSKTPSTIYNGQTFRLRNGTWVTSTDKPVTDEATKTQLHYNHLIDSSNMSPILTHNGMSYYMINQDSSNSVVMMRNNKTRFINSLSAEDAKRVIDKVNKDKAEEERKKAAEAYIESLPSFDLNDNAPTPLDEAMESKPEPKIEEKKEREENKETPTQDVISNKSLTELQDRSNSTTYEAIATHPEYQERLDSIIDEKIDNGTWEDFPDDVSEIAEYFKKKGIATEGITDIESWLSMIEECK